MTDTTGNKQIYYIEGLQNGEKGAENLHYLRRVCEDCSKTSGVRLVLPKGTFEIGDAKSRDDLEDLLSGRISPYTRWNETGTPYNKAFSFSDTPGLEIYGQGTTLILTVPKILAFSMSPQFSLFVIFNSVITGMPFFSHCSSILVTR